MNFRIVVRHNGTVWENFFSADQIWDTATWIEELSRYTTLHPGVLRNYVVAETS
jgi:2-keto-4-pentenoate hydratase/2-oxohepta-3-ene-1,7-dioic acid hydratase in catechol pathway